MSYHPRLINGSAGYKEDKANFHTPYAKYTMDSDMCDNGLIFSYGDVKKGDNETDSGLRITSRKLDQSNLSLCESPFYAQSPVPVPCNAPVIPATHPSNYISNWQNHDTNGGNRLQLNPINNHLYSAVNSETGSVIVEYSIGEEKLLPKLNKENTFSPGKYIFDMQCRNYDSDSFLMTRSAKSAELFKVNGDSIQSCCVSKCDQRLTKFHLSYDTPIRWLHCTEGLDVHFHDSQREKPVWSCSLKESVCKWCVAVFSSRSEEAFAITDSQIYRLDFRTKGSYSVYVDLEAYEDVLELSPLCEVVPMSNGRPYVFHITASKAILWDDRSNKSPVLTWRHLLTDRPRRAVFKSFDDRDMLFLSSEQDHRVSCIAMSGFSGAVETSQHFGRSLGNSKHFECIKSLSDFANFNDLFFFEEFDARLKYCYFSGMECTSSSSDNNSDITCFVSNHLGDIFSCSLTYKEGKDSLSIEQEDYQQSVLERLNLWQDLVLESQEPEIPKTLLDLSNHTVLDRPRRGNKKKPPATTRGITGTSWNLVTLANAYLGCGYYRMLTEGIRNMSWRDLLVNDFMKSDSVKELEVEENKSDSIEDDGDVSFMVSKKDIEEIGDVPFMVSKKDIEEIGDVPFMVSKKDIEESDDRVARKVLDYFHVSPPKEESRTESYYAVPYSKYFSKSQNSPKKVEKFKKIETKTPQPAQETSLPMSSPGPSSTVSATPQLPLPSTRLKDIISASPLDASLLFSSQQLPRIDRMSLLSNLTGSQPILSNISSRKRKRFTGF